MATFNNDYYYDDVEGLIQQFSAIDGREKITPALLGQLLKQMSMYIYWVGDALREALDTIEALRADVTRLENLIRLLQNKPTVSIPGGEMGTLSDEPGETDNSQSYE